MRKIAFDAFGTLLNYNGHRMNPYLRLLTQRDKKKAPRPPFMTRDVPVHVFAEELGLSNLLPIILHELDAEAAAIQLYPDVEATLRQLRAAGCEIVVCSNLAQPYGAVVKRLLPDLDGYILSYEVGAEKPDPMIYQSVCDVLGCSPGDVTFIGDNPLADVEGPTRFGMRAHLIRRATGQKLMDLL